MRAYGIDISWYFMGMEDFKKTVTRNTIVKLVTIALIFILVRNSNDLSKYIFLLGFAQVAGLSVLFMTLPLKRSRPVQSQDSPLCIL